MPQFLSLIKYESDKKLQGEKFGAKSRATRETVYGNSVNSIMAFPKTKNKVSLEPREINFYSKAGMPKGVK